MIDMSPELSIVIITVAALAAVVIMDWGDR